MDTTKRRIKFIPIPRRLLIDDFQRMTTLIAQKYDNLGTPLFRHRKSLNELACILFKMWKQGYLTVYSTQEEPDVPVGILACSVQELWWIDGKVLMEDLVVSFTDSDIGFGRFAVRQMELLAQVNTCSLILSGSSMVERTKEVTNLYTKRGFVVTGVSFLKEV